MKKVLFSLICALLCSTVVWAAADYTLTPTAGSNNSYAGNCDVIVDNITWNVTGNATTLPWRIGGKSLTSVNREVYSKTAYSSAASKIDLTVGAASSITVNSLKLVYSTNADFSDASEISKSFAANSTISFEAEFPANAFFKFVFNVTVSGTSNKFVEFSKVEIYNASGSSEPAPALTAVTVSGAPTKTVYQEGEVFAPAGLTVTGTYDDNTTAAITSGITWTVTPATGLTAGTTSVSVVATVGEISSAAYTVNGLTVNAIPVYANLAALVAAGEPTTAGSKVTVTLTDEEILSFYTSTSGENVYRNGINLQATAEQQIEVYCRDVPAEWVVGGTVSGTLTCTWKKYNSTWELCPTSWNELTYAAPAASEKQNPVLAWMLDDEEVTALTFVFEEADYVLPEFTYTAGDGEPTFATSNSAVAEVMDGEISIVGVGSATITVTTPETDNFNAGELTLTITVTAAPVADDPNLLLYESFSQTDGTGANDDVWNGNIAANDIVYDVEGWTGEKLGGAANCLKVGASKNLGYATTPAVTATTPELYITFKAAAWEGDASEMLLSADNGTLDTESVSLTNAEWGNYTVRISNIDMTNPVHLTFSGKQASKARFFLDEVKIYSATNRYPTSVDNAATDKAQKIVRDGKIVILKNGAEYSVLGQKM